MIQSNTGYVMLGKQTAKGAATTPGITIPNLDDTFSTDHSITGLKNSEDFTIDSMKDTHRETFGWTCYARPDLVCYLLAYFMGADSKSGGADPYTHTLTLNERAWLTVERKLYTSKVQRLVDGKIESITLSGEAGQPIRLTVEGTALSVNIIATEQTPSYESRNPFMFYNGEGRFKYATTADDLIKSFTIQLSMNSGGGLTDDAILLSDLPDVTFDCNVSMDLYTEDMTRWQNINYYGTVRASEEIYKAAVEIDLQYLQTSTRQLKVTIPQVYWQSIGGVQLSGVPNTLIESVAGVAEKQATTEILTCVCMNSLAADLI